MNINPNKRFYLGIDGGGTKTEFILIDQCGNLIGFSRKGTCHLKQGSLIDFKEIILSGILEVLKPSNLKISDIYYAVLGIPGYGEFKKDKENIDLIIKEIFNNKNFKCINDGLVALYGSLACDYGINIVSGTGSIGFGIDKKGKISRVGGWGPNLGDEGSAYWIGKKVLELFTKQSDGRVEKTYLYNMVKEYFKIENDLDILSLLVEEKRMDRKEIAKLSFINYKSAKLGDIYSKEIFEKASFEYFLMIKTLINKLNFNKKNEILISYSGSVFKSSEFILPKLELYMNNTGYNILLKEAILKPISGAVLYSILENSNLTKHEKTNLITRLKDIERKIL